MEEILHQLIVGFIPLFQGFYTSQVVQDFFHQLYHHDILTFNSILYMIQVSGRNVDTSKLTTP